MESYWRAWVNGRWRLVERPRKIERGRDAGRWEVSVRETCQPKGEPWRLVERRRVVDEVKAVG